MEYQQTEAKNTAHGKCRACHGDFFAAPLLKYINMPASAQGFLTASELPHDRGVDVEVCQCAGCGLVQLNNAPVSYYRDVIRAAAYSEEMRAFRIAQFKQWRDAYNLQGKAILEIGSGKGEYLALLKEVGLNAFGIEHAAEAVSTCQAQGLSVAQGYLGDNLGDDTLQPLLGSPYDGFVCLNFMEHWPDPVASLKALHRHLTPDAIGLVEVPNFDMILRMGLFSEFIADHLFYFTQQSLTQLLQNNGFEVLSCQSVWHDYVLSAVVKRRAPTNLASFAHFRDSISQRLNQFIDRFPPRQVAVWGAGHQALAVIALAQLSEKIAYVVDSAPFKQGKYTPASHLQVVAPSHLIERPVQAVMIMAASYSDEVARTLRAHYPADLEVVILRDDRLETVN